MLSVFILLLLSVALTEHSVLCAVRGDKGQGCGWRCGLGDLFGRGGGGGQGRGQGRGALRFLGRSCGLAETESESLVPAHSSSSIFTEKSICERDEVEREREEGEMGNCRYSAGDCSVLGR